MRSFTGLANASASFRWVFGPMHPAEMGAPWWINRGAVAIATLAGARIMHLRGLDPSLLGTQHFVGTFTVVLSATSTFWIPLLLIMFAWKELRRGPYGYDPGLWSVVFPLGMYVTATHVLPRPRSSPFWSRSRVRCSGWPCWHGVLTFVGLAVRLLGMGPR